jgi:hypothetical protein
MPVIALALVAILWIGVAAVVAGVCASAAQGDRRLPRATARRAAAPEAPRFRRLA